MMHQNIVHHVVQKLCGQMTDELKHCPTCGKTDTVIITDDTVVSNYKMFRVICSCKLGGCGTSTGHRPTAEEVVNLWNTRI